ncbi:segment polarity protein dishevelled homolog DVL-3 isoform X3 [Takifugu flavidus]|uniref:segment polarity protein dishevelled homolog DVL-3 isoform X3 n=1 Tax=Takifugu flavidus TaxID=433684 RepID=UPI002544C5B2|nr:segment polarity protein dishevelled homolog DVL-3 isoform X3 [Takifugu flavidus]
MEDTETRVIYHMEDQDTPYLIRINVPAQRVTLADFKRVLNKPNLKFFFKAVDDDFGVVKEEVSDDAARLPCVNGRVVCWLVSTDACQSDSGDPPLVPAVGGGLTLPPTERTGGIGDSRPPSFHAADIQRSEVRPVPSPQGGAKETGSLLNGQTPHLPDREEAEQPGGGEGSSTQQSSQLETTSFCSSGDDSGGRFSQSTGPSSPSPQLIRRQRRRHRRPKTSQMERSVSFSSITDSTMSLSVVTVTLNMERFNFLGISIVGQSNDRGDGGIYIGSIMKGGAVAADGRIEPGDMLLQVNDTNFENMTNDDAVQVLRDVVHNPGPITLTVAKCWDPNPQSCFILPRGEPVRPIDPAAWVSHTAAMTGTLPPPYSLHEEHHLTIQSDMPAVVRAMANPESGLEVRDRMWLKITIRSAFIGSEVVDWLHRNVEGFVDRREARKYAGNLLKAGYIRHTINKVTFSEQCYYVFGDLCEADGANCEPVAQPPGPAWPPVFPYQDPAPHPYSSPLPLHQLPAEDGGDEKGSQPSEGSHSCPSNYSDNQGCGLAGPEPARLEAGALLQEEPPVSNHPPGSTDPPVVSDGDLSPPQQPFLLTTGNPRDFFVDVI